MAESKDPSPKVAVESPGFEDSFLRLNEMAEQLEAGGLTLAEATAHFEEGMKLVQLCNDMLTNAELRITELKATYHTAGTQTGSQRFDDDTEDDFEE